jgi:hypothetical protein
LNVASGACTDRQGRRRARRAPWGCQKRCGLVWVDVSARLVGDDARLGGGGGGARHDVALDCAARAGLEPPLARRTLGVCVPVGLIAAAGVVGAVLARQVDVIALQVNE